MLSDQPGKQLRLQRPQFAIADGLDGGRAIGTPQQRHLAEEIAAPQIRPLFARAVAINVSAQSAVADDIHRAGWLALADHELTGADRSGGEPVQQRTQPLGREVSEGGVLAEEIA